jgi:hypothetical protein
MSVWVGVVSVLKAACVLKMEGDDEELGKACRFSLPNFTNVLLECKEFRSGWLARVNKTPRVVKLGGARWQGLLPAGEISAIADAEINHHPGQSTSLRTLLARKAVCETCAAVKFLLEGIVLIYAPNSFPFQFSRCSRRVSKQVPGYLWASRCWSVAQATDQM